MIRSKTSLFMLLVLSLLLVFSGLSHAAYDFGGKTVTYVSDGGIPARFSAGGEAEGRLEEAEEIFNTQIEFLQVPFGEWVDSFMTRLLAGDSTNDIVYMQQRQYWKLVPQGAFYPMNNILTEEYYEGLPEFSRSVMESLKVAGKIYAFGNKFNAIHPMRVFAYNTSLFEREGLPDLYELYQNDEWNWEQLEDIAIQATRDTDGDGEIDQFGLANPSGIWFAISNDARVSKFNENGKRVFSFDEPAAIKAMEFVYKLQNIDKVVGGDWQATAFADGKVAMQPMGMYLLGNKVKPVMEDEYKLVPYPLGPDSADYRYPAEALVLEVLPANVEDPEGLVELYQYLWPVEEYEEWVDNYLESLVRDRQSYDVLMGAHDNWSGEAYDLEMVLSWQETPFNTAYWQAMGGEKGFAAAMAEAKPGTQAILDEIFNQ